MALASTGLPCAITDNSSTARARLGEIYGTWDATYGERHWIYVKNTTGGDLSAGLGVMQKNGTTLFETTLSGASTPTVRMLGIAQHTITSNYYGFVLARGMGVVVSNGTTSANTAQKAVANGRFDDGVIGTDDLPVFALEAQAVAALTFTAKINCL
jgi:hypothetical protein